MAGGTAERPDRWPTSLARRHHLLAIITHVSATLDLARDGDLPIDEAVATAQTYLNVALQDILRYGQPPESAP